MKLQQRQTTLLLFFFLAFSVFASAQEMQDTTKKKLLLKTFESNLNRTQQLAVLDAALGEKFDLSYELKLLLQNMSDEELDKIFKTVYRKAKKPVPATGPVAKIYWKDVEHDFGTVKAGKLVKYVFEFTNIGKIPYQITDIEGSCGCTIGKYTEGIIPPGGKGEVVVSFDSAGKSGENTELITVIGNSYPARVVLVININVK